MIVKLFLVVIFMIKSGISLQYERILKQSEYLEKCGVDFENLTVATDKSLTFDQISPFMASIVLENMNLNLTGALISNKLIMTRGTPLIYPKNPKKFRTISIDRLKIFISNTQVQPLKILVHPEIENSVNDIALIVLEDPVELNNKTQPVCLWISSASSSNNFKHFYIANNQLETSNNSSISSVKCEKNESVLVCNESKATCRENHLLFLFINQKWFLRGVQLSCEEYEEINLKTSIWILSRMFRDGRGAKWGLWMHLLALLTATLVIVSIGLATIAYNLYTKRKMEQSG